MAIPPGAIPSAGGREPPAAVQAFDLASRACQAPGAAAQRREPEGEGGRVWIVGSGDYSPRPRRSGGRSPRRFPRPLWGSGDGRGYGERVKKYRQPFDWRYGRSRLRAASRAARACNAGDTAPGTLIVAHLFAFVKGEISPLVKFVPHARATGGGRAALVVVRASATTRRTETPRRPPRTDATAPQTQHL